MMITLLLIGILTVSELFFLIWNLKEHTRHEKIHLYVRLGGALLLLFGLLTTTQGLTPDCLESHSLGCCPRSA